MGLIPVIKFSPAAFDVHGSWHYMTPYTTKLLASILQNPQELVKLVEDGSRAAQFLHYIQSSGVNCFGDATDNGLPCKLAIWKDPSGIEHKCLIRTALGPNSSSIRSGSSGHFISASQGPVFFKIQNISDVIDRVSTVNGIVSLVNEGLSIFLTKYLESLKAAQVGDVASCVTAGRNAVSDGEVAARKVAKVESAMKWMTWVEHAGTAVDVFALLVQGFMDIFHRITISLSIWNETNEDLEWSVTYLGQGSQCLNPSETGGFDPLPAMNTVDQGLIPFGGHFPQDKIAVVNLTFANGSNNVSFSVYGVQACVTIRLKNDPGTNVTILLDAPLLDTNRMYLGSGLGDAQYVAVNLSKAQATQKTTLSIPEANGKILTVSLVTDQMSGQTTYAGNTGYNYNVLAHIK